MQSQTAAIPDDIDLRTLKNQALRGLPSLVLMSALVGAVTFGALSTMAPRYESETQLAIDSKSLANPYDAGSATSVDHVAVRMDKEAVNTHVRALQSADLADKVARELKLAARPEFNSALGPEDDFTAALNAIGIGLPRAGETEQSRVLNAFAKHLEVYSPKESRSIGIRFSSSDPELAATVANKLADTYRETLARQSLIETSEVQKALEPKIAKLTDETAAAEAAVETFRGKANIFRGGGGQQASGLNEQQLAELNAELSKARTQRSEADARARQAREMLDAGNADALPDVQKSPLMQSLVQSRVRIERQVSELSTSLLPGHPRMRQLNGELAGLKTQIKTEVAKIVDSLAKEAKVAALREESIAKNLAEVKTRIVNTGPDEAKLRSLEADAKSKRAELDRLRAQYEGNRLRVDDQRTVPVEADVVSRARPSSVPVFPRKVPTALLASGATLLIGLALIITRGLLSTARVPAQRLQSAPVRREPEPQTMPTLDRTPARSPAPRPLESMSAPIPAPIPAQVSAPVSAPAPTPVLTPELAAPAPTLAAHAEPETSAAVVAERLDRARRPGFSGVRTLVAARSDAFTLADDARTLATALTEKGLTVVVVDWDLTGGGIAEALGHPSFPGLVELLKGKATFEEVIHPHAKSTMHVIPAGHGRGEAGEDLDVAHVNEVLDALDSAYDHVLVVAREQAAEALFDALEGRFDCGLRIVDQHSRPVAPGTFLGFNVDDVELLSYQRPASTPADQQRYALAG